MINQSFEYFPKLNYDGFKDAAENISDFLKMQGLSTEAVQEQIVIAEQLLIACLRYSGTNPTFEKTKIQIHLRGGQVTTEVSNPIDNIEIEQLEHLDKLIQYLRGYQDPFEAFTKMKTTSNNGSTGLSLAEMAYLNQTTLDFFVSEDNMLNLSAVSNIN